MANRQEKRSIRNVVMTNKHHSTYLGNWVMMCLSFIAIIYLLILYHLYSLSLSDAPPQLVGVVAGATMLAGLLAGLVGFYGVLTAHRIAGVHIKLRNVLNEVKEGNLDVRLRFRAYDKLDDVEHAFNGMMEVLQMRIQRLEGGNVRAKRVASEAVEPTPPPE